MRVFARLAAFALMICSALPAFAGDLDQVAFCRIENFDSPPNQSYRRLEIYWDHKTPNGIAVLEYVVYRGSKPFMGKEAFFVDLQVSDSAIAAIFKTDNHPPLTIAWSLRETTLAWAGHKYQCVGRW